MIGNGPGEVAGKRSGKTIPKFELIPQWCRVRYDFSRLSPRRTRLPRASAAAGARGAARRSLLSREIRGRGVVTSTRIAAGEPGRHHHDGDAMKITYFPGVVPDGEPPVPPAMLEAVRESGRHGFDQHIRNLYVAHSPPDGAPDLDNFWTAALWLASAAHHGNGLPWADAFDSVIQRITGRPTVERAGAISEIFIEYKLHESPEGARGLKARLNGDWHGAPDETL